MEVIKDVRDLPEWFDISKYDYLSQFEEMVLFEQLDIRANLKNMLKHNKWPDIQESWYGNKSSFLRDWTQIKETGRAKHFRPWSKKDKDRFKTVSNINTPTFDTPNIQAMRIVDIEVFNRENDYFIEERILMDSSLSPEQIRYSSCDYQWQQLTPDHNHLHLALDLTVPDSVLIEEMRGLLKKYRKRSKVIPPKDHLTPEKIVKGKIIPYLDLSIWADINQVTISHDSYSRALFPYGGKGEYEVRTSISNNAKKAISDTYLHKLFSQAALTHRN